IIFAMVSALRWMFGRSVAMFGIERSATNSSTMSRSCFRRQSRADFDAGLVCAETLAAKTQVNRIQRFIRRACILSSYRGPDYAALRIEPPAGKVERPLPG